VEHVRKCLGPGSLALLLVLIGSILLGGCFDGLGANVAMASTEKTVPGGNVQRGAQLIPQYGCGSCHTIAGIDGAKGLVGPPLTGIADRAYIAGMLANNPDNMVTWIMHPQQVVPGNAMLDLGVSDADARDIAAYLYTLRAR
jgi:cytochrome c